MRSGVRAARKTEGTETPMERGTDDVSLKGKRLHTLKTSKPHRVHIYNMLRVKLQPGPKRTCSLGGPLQTQDDI